jgi:hypothetical protein
MNTAPLSTPPNYRDNFVNMLQNPLFVCGGILLLLVILFSVLSYGKNDPVTASGLARVESDLAKLNFVTECRPDNSESWLHPKRGYVPANAIELRKMLAEGIPFTNASLSRTDDFLKECWQKLVNEEQRKEDQARAKVKADAQLRALAPSSNK